MIGWQLVLYMEMIFVLIVHCFPTPQICLYKVLFTSLLGTLQVAPYCDQFTYICCFAPFIKVLLWVYSIVPIPII